jgi:hypothetical protein
MQLRFDDGFLFDTDRRQLSRGEQELSLSPKAYELLRLLIEARPKAIAKEKLYRSLWPNTHVVEANLPKSDRRDSGGGRRLQPSSTNHPDPASLRLRICGRCGGCDSGKTGRP